jgi:glycosyltransferase involved in cell wall biosynthesis
MKFLVVGPKAPPVTGYANIVAGLVKQLQKNTEFSTFHLSTVPNKIAYLFPGVVWKILRMFYSFGILVIAPYLILRCDILYININGGLGKIYDLIILLFARVLRKKIVIHHHSFSYLQEKKVDASSCFYVAGHASTHIVNCQCMKNKLVSLYSLRAKVKVYSNATIMISSDLSLFETKKNINNKSIASDSNSAYVLGYMAYLNREKGLELFCKTVKNLNDNGITAKGIAVGPIHDIQLVKSLEENYGNYVNFSGPVYGHDRDFFFEKIDLFVFPSLYLTEAEPLTIYNALGKGLPIVSTEVGCLRAMLEPFNLCRSFTQESFIDETCRFVSAELRPSKTNIRNNRFRIILERKKALLTQSESFNDFIRTL